MAHSFSSVLYHLVWSTKGRKPLIDAAIKPRLYAYLRTLAESYGCKIISINGMNDHIHILISLTVSHHIPDIIRDLKTNSTKFVRSHFANCTFFSWQKGFGAFTVGLTSKERTIKYIENQEIHHEKVSFENEFLYFLKIHSIKFDPRFVLD